MVHLRSEKKTKEVADMMPRKHQKMKKYWREENKVRSNKNRAVA